MLHPLDENYEDEYKNEDEVDVEDDEDEVENDEDTEQIFRIVQISIMSCPPLAIASSCILSLCHLPLSPLTINVFSLRFLHYQVRQKELTFSSFYDLMLHNSCISVQFLFWKYQV